MGKIFEKLLLSNEILSQEELEHYKKIVQQLPEKKHLGQLLLEKRLLQPAMLEKLLQAEQETKKQLRTAKQQKYDKRILAAVQQLGIVARKELNDCLQEQQEAEARGEIVFLSDILIANGYLTQYLVKKFAHQELVIAPKIANEELILNIPQYLRDRFLGKIILKNHILNREQFCTCWEDFKKSWPRKGLIESITSRNLLSESKMKVLLEVLKKNITKKYPYLDAQVRDIEMAKLLAKKNFLSPGRLNRCLLQQLPIIKQKQYIALRKILVDQGFLTNYTFDIVLKAYGSLVLCDPPGLLVPSNEVKVLKREQIAKAIQEAKSDVHLIVEEEEMGKIRLTDDFFQHAEVTSEVVEVKSEKTTDDPIIEMLTVDDEDEILPPLETTKNPLRQDSFELLLDDLNPQEPMLTPDRIVLVEQPDQDDPEILDMEIEDDDLDVQAIQQVVDPEASLLSPDEADLAKNAAGSYPVAGLAALLKKQHTPISQKDASSSDVAEKK